MSKKPVTISWPVFTSEQQCSSATGIPLFLLKQAKAAGAPGFSYGRLRFGEVLPWLFKHPASSATLPAGYSSWRDYWNAVCAKRAELALEKDRGNVLDRADTGDGITRGISVLFDSLNQVFLNQMPSQLVGLDEIQISTKMQAAITRLEDECRTSLTALSKKEL